MLRVLLQGGLVMVKKSEIRHWLKNTRISLAEIERILKQPGPLDDDDLDAIGAHAMDYSVDGANIQELTGYGD